MFPYVLLAFQLFPMPKDPVRAAEIQQQTLVDSARQHEHDVRARQQLQLGQFELKFNQLVDAVASFAQRYNEGKGQTWPFREEEKLRQAMNELQSVQKSLQGARSSTPKPSAHGPPPNPRWLSADLSMAT